MRTTVTLDDDVAAALGRFREQSSRGVSEIVNELIRAGLRERGRPRRRFSQKTDAMGIRLDVTNVAEALDLLDGPDHR